MVNNKTRKSKKLNKLHCGPIKRNKTLKHSCFDDKTLFQLKEIINLHSDEIKIESNKPKKIWHELNKKIPDCKNEQCWLKHIKNDKLVAKINKYYFAPKQPKDWKENPNTWLYGRDIIHVLEQYEFEYPNFKFIGPSPIDFDSSVDIFHTCVEQELCDFSLEKTIQDGYNKVGIIFNLDKHYQSGSHWTSMFIDLKDNFIYYMDSAATKIPKEVNELVKRIMEQNNELKRPKLTFHNNKIEHQKGNSECGMYSLYFIVTMLMEKTNNETLKNRKEKIDYFSNKRIPDNLVFEYREKYFNK